MKKIVKMSLVAAVAVAGLQTGALAADTLADAFANGKVKGSVKAYYFSKTYDNATTKDASILVTGGQLGYKTEAFNGLSLGTTFQYSSTPSKDDDSSKYSWSMDANGAVASEGYLQYDVAKTTIKAGRQFFWTPVVGGSGSRFIRQSFSGISLSSSDIANTKIVAAHMSKFADRTDKAGSPGEFGKGRIGLDGTQTVYVKNNSLKELTLQAQYATSSETVKSKNDGHAILYIDGTYKMSGDLKPYIAAQYLTTSYDSGNTNTKDGVATGLKVGATISGLGIYVAYTTVGKDNSVKQGIGSGSIPLFTNGNQVDAWSATVADTKSTKVGLSYKIGAVSLGLAHSEFDRKNNAKVKETGANITYKATKNLTAQLQYSMNDGQYLAKTPENDIQNDIRTRLIYSF